MLVEKPEIRTRPSAPLKKGGKWELEDIHRQFNSKNQSEEKKGRESRTDCAVTLSRTSARVKVFECCGLWLRHSDAVELCEFLYQTL